MTDPGQVADALTGADAVISTYGVPHSKRIITVCSEGIRNIIKGMHHHSITRLVRVSSISVAPGEASGKPLFWREALIPFLRKVIGRTLYDDMQHMKIVEGSDLDWTIIRPDGPFNTPAATGDYVVSAKRMTGCMTSRADLTQPSSSEPWDEPPLIRH